MRRLAFALLGPLATAITVAVLVASCSPRLPIEQILAAYDENASYADLAIRYPQNETVFPPEIVPCTFTWQEAAPKSDTWLILVQFQNGSGSLHYLSSATNWTPRVPEWEEIKRRSREKPANISVLGFRRAAPLNLLSRARISISTSKDEVGAPIFYREVNLPFMEAVKDPSRIRWRFGTISSPNQPPVVLEHLPVCGNCHSFSTDGRTLGMDVDYANNKGSYVITHVAQEMPLASSDIITWDSYRPEDHQRTYGLLSQVSPNGQVAISTVKDKSVFVAKPDLAFSQLFFPIKGILAVYHRQSGRFESLPGADDPAYVQSNPSWSPDGKYIVFARAQAYDLKNKGAEDKLLLSAEDCAEFLQDGKPFLFDLYRIPYNNGQGGKPEPLKGASRNGRSNFFAKFSPDGKWIVFCQARSYMLLQPDSELYIIPAEGGEARRLRCNTARMNSWHSWSPNGRWLVFSSKANSPHTQLFLTHIDGNGESAPPVLLAHFTSPDRAANIPEFVNTQPGAIARIQEQFLNDYSHARAGFVFEMNGDLDQAITEYEKALKINPKNEHAHQRLGFLLYHGKQRQEEGLAHTVEALKLDPQDPCAHYDMGMALRHQEQLEAAIQHLTLSARLMTERVDARYNPANASFELGDALMANGKPAEAATVLDKAASLDPKNARVHYLLAVALAAQGLVLEPMQHYATACSLQPAIDTAPEFHFLMSVNYENAGQFRDALRSAEKAFEMAKAKGDPNLLEAFQERLEASREKAVPPQAQ